MAKVKVWLPIHGSALFESFDDVPENWKDMTQKEKVDWFFERSYDSNAMLCHSCSKDIQTDGCVNEVWLDQADDYEFDFYVE